jgi:hypothetical protein
MQQTARGPQMDPQLQEVQEYRVSYVSLPIVAGLQFFQKDRVHKVDKFFLVNSEILCTVLKQVINYLPSGFEISATVYMIINKIFNSI